MDTKVVCPEFATKTKTPTTLTLTTTDGQDKISIVRERLYGRHYVYSVINPDGTTYMTHTPKQYYAIWGMRLLWKNRGATVLGTDKVWRMKLMN